jgi:hypothetical protein
MTFFGLIGTVGVEGLKEEILRRWLRMTGRGGKLGKWEGLGLIGQALFFLHPSFLSLYS